MSNKPITYEQVSTLFAMYDDPADLSLSLRPNTVAVLEGDSFDVLLYGTRVATIYADGSVRVDRNGFNSATTRNRINDVLIPLGWKIKVKEGRWTLITITAPYRSMEFIDGMILTNINQKESK